MNDTAYGTKATAAKPVREVDRLLLQFEESFDQTQNERKLSERDRDYYDNSQLTDEELATLAKRGQPPVISNRIGPKIDALLGHEKRMRTDPRAYPRTPQHQEDAESVTDAVRFVCDSNRFSEIRSSVAENVFIEGIGAATVTVRMVNGQPEVEITDIPWDRFYRDPHSRRPDFSDADFMGVVLWMDEARAIGMFPDKKDIIQGCYTEGVSIGDTFDDRPKVTWSDEKRKRIRVLQHRWIEGGKWMTAVLCRSGYLRDPQVSPYLDEAGVPQCDIVATSAYVNRENERYGVARRHISAQDEINKRRSKALHLLNSRQIIAEKGAVESVPQARREMAKPDGYVEVVPNMRFETVDAPGLVEGQFRLLQESKAEIDASGVNPALEGDTRAPSGRAQEMLTAAGLAEMAKPFEAVKNWSWRVYRQVWLRIRQYWTEERWIRVTDDDQNLRWVALNRPITLADQMRADAEQGKPVAPLPPGDPRLNKVVGHQNKLAELDVDIILEDGPDSITIQSEQFDALVEMKKADPAAIPTRAIIEASSLRNKDKILEHLDSNGVPPQLQKQMQQAQEHVEQLEKQLREAQEQLADREIERKKLEIEAYKAETDRIQALRPLPPPRGDIADPNQPPQGGFFMGDDQQGMPQ
ncbi:hypothetical protein ASD78_12265 [Lysobacter sp. Root667]|uniref:portal protein n=1 Tax=Lysobacter sp. Root667 TaxID=1736581 RepID=UPI0006F92D91|nr:hypothetical protein [Lysobacter sp. Root667]KRA74260.1 hypothetical protein ASD78_12265 [Lysobacter sp. Root667]